MTGSPKRVAVLGSTGSIGQNALQVIACSGGRLRAVALSAHSQLEVLREQAMRCQPHWVVATDSAIAQAFDWGDELGEAAVLTGQQGLEEIVRSPEVDVVLAAIVGSAGLRSTWAAIDAGKTVALANKETLVMAGPLVMALAESRGAQILPVDSEHSAIFQCLAAGRRHEVQRIVLTASGGPFRDRSVDSMRHVTVEDALSHPTWKMGPKITVDSATMMNKALEVIEARWLFGMGADEIEVVVHPQSVVHSMVEFVDGSVVSQMSPPDMKLPIQFALHYPDRQVASGTRLDWQHPLQLEFRPVDREQFPAVDLGFEVARAGGTAGAVLNAANEAAVQAFLAGELHFTEIVPACRSVVGEHHFDADPTLDDLVAIDRWARKEVASWVCA